ncbi:unnamed protein product [Periconia digitata]|uniref:Uncharacterized protein n=1 Tax=Periconia digitata TaxID=1303443 RepID=A0A9W4UDX8_9PLEO|nr:unnamed protein product [Periconia digitata]
MPSSAVLAVNNSVGCSFVGRERAQLMMILRKLIFFCQLCFLVTRRRFKGQGHQRRVARRTNQVARLVGPSLRPVTCAKSPTLG